jgi:hypothetical protein
VNRLALPPLPQRPTLALSEPQLLQTLARATAIRALRLAGGAPPGSEASAVSPLRVAAGASRVIDSVRLPPRRSTHHAKRQRASAPVETVAVTLHRPDVVP